jgi:hypothetical protein
MSRCVICNVVLSEAELKHKDPLSGQYTDTCTHCLTEHEFIASDASERVEYVFYGEDNDAQDNQDVLYE